MKIRVERDVLAEAVAWAARSLPARPPAPVLAGLLLKAEDGALSLSSFDYEVSARVSVEAETEEEGTVLVSGRLLALHPPHPAGGGVPGAAADADRHGHRPRRRLRLGRRPGRHRRGP